MPTLLLMLPASPDPWIAHFGELMPELRVVADADAVDPAEVDFIYAWAPEPGRIADFPNVKAIFSLGAGVEKIIADPTIPAHIPIARVVDPEMTQRMVEFVTLAVLYLHRDWGTLRNRQKDRVWKGVFGPAAGGRPVGILGAGQLGAACGKALAGLGFPVTAWARGPKEVPGITVVSGPDGLDRLLAGSAILVNLLPLTPETTGICDARLFARLPQRAGFVSAARGDHVVEKDLLAALDHGRIGHAVLDVFEREPLPADHPFWSHPRVTVSPHIASIVDRKRRAALAVAGIRKVLAGGLPDHLADRARGY